VRVFLDETGLEARVIHFHAQGLGLAPPYLQAKAFESLLRARPPLKFAHTVLSVR